MAAFDPRDVHSRVRGCLLRLLTKTSAGFDGDPEEYVAGHVAEGVRTRPPGSPTSLAKHRHEHADGLVRRLIVAEPYRGDGRRAQWAVRVLQGALLTDENGRAAELMYQGRTRNSRATGTKTAGSER